MATTPNSKKSSYEEGSLDQYLRDISAYPLITREEEVRARAAHPRRATRKRSTSSCARTCASSSSVAKKYQNQGVSLSDLINEGNLGLIRAAHKFDETKGIKFISYAVWWIRQAILQALAEQSRIVRVPLNRAGTLHRIGKRASMLLQELGREATHAEIAEGMDITEEEVAKTMSISQTHLSLDAPLTPGEDNRLLDYLPDKLNPTPDEQTFEKALTESDRGSARAPEGARGEDPAPLLRPRRRGADDARADRQPAGDHARAGAADQGEGALAGCGTCAGRGRWSRTWGRADAARAVLSERLSVYGRPREVSGAGRTRVMSRVSIRWTHARLFRCGARLHLVAETEALR